MRRSLIPTWIVETYEGLAASDNAFVTVEGDDWLPDLAIGRLPVVQPEEVTAIVNKIIAYAQPSEIGPWRRNVLWITNENIGFQHVSDSLDRGLRGKGFAGRKVYPSADEKDNTTHQAMLREAFDEGQVLVHFLGHGGRYIWRTGPPDYRKNHDLFTLENLERLAPNTRLPLILSMTCYSAPFDHPTADSIGEKFRRMPDRGAIAVLAASWRNTPTGTFSHLLMKQLMKPGTAIGEAVMRAKKRINSQIMVETYNLLGDPALALAIPKHRLALMATSTETAITISGSLEEVGLTAGRVIVDWLDQAGQVMYVQEQAVKGKRFTIGYLRVQGQPLPVGARVYIWNPERRVDGIGTVQIVSEDNTLVQMSSTEAKENQLSCCAH
jgi:hypothetical protein